LRDLLNKWVVEGVAFDHHDSKSVKNMAIFTPIIMKYSLYAISQSFFYLSFRIPSQSTASVGMDQAKLDKKRERNRIAASKCRQRKMEKIQTLGKLLKKYLLKLKILKNSKVVHIGHIKGQGVSEAIFSWFQFSQNAKKKYILASKMG
jgi:hypothetical protein